MISGGVSEEKAGLRAAPTCNGKRFRWGRVDGNDFVDEFVVQLLNSQVLYYFRVDVRLVIGNKKSVVIAMTTPTWA